jgi:hypothetical protein
MPTKYYSYSKLLSYNATYNLLIGNRGQGKTFGAKLKALKDGIYKGDMFIYLRRYKDELATAKRTFFADIEKKFPKHDFRVCSDKAQWSLVSERESKKREWFTIGYFVALSQAQNYKSASFPIVKTIIFDEFIIEKSATHYLPDESTIFNNFYSTVDRWLDKTRVFFLANSVSIMNPYFIAWNIVPQPGQDFIIKNKGFVVCHIADNKEFNEEVYETNFGKFIKDSEYADYAVENTFADNTEQMLKLKDTKARYLFTLECRTGQFSIWYNIFSSYYWIQKKLPREQEIYTLVSDKMTNEKMLLSFTDRPLANLRTAFRQGSMSFDNQVTRNTFMEVFKR